MRLISSYKVVTVNQCQHVIRVLCANACARSNTKLCHHGGTRSQQEKRLQDLEVPSLGIEPRSTTFVVNIIYCRGQHLLQDCH